MFSSVQELYEYKLNSLLEITQKINSEFTEDDLLDLFVSKMEGLIEINSMALFVFSRHWQLKKTFGLTEELTKNKHDFLKFDELTYLNKEEYKDWPFDIIFPVFQKKKKVAYILLKYNLKPQEDTELPFIRSLSNIVFGAIENKNFRERRFRQKDLEKELTIAGEVQSLLVPKNLPKNEEIEMNSTYIPHSAIGGDYFDYIEEDDDRFLVCIADVSGKGVPAALLMSNFQATLKALVKHHISLKDIVRELNANVFAITNGERFITAFFGIYCKKTKTLKYINAGHNPPFYLDKNKDVREELKTGTTLLGAFQELPFINQGEIKILDYSLLFMYTDGLVEIFDEYGTEFGEIGLEHFLRTENNTSLEGVHDELLDLILSYSSAGFQDDITILSCKFRY